MNDHLLIAIGVLIVGIVMIQDYGFEHRWCATYPDWCMPVSADDSDLFVDWYDDV